MKLRLLACAVALGLAASCTCGPPPPPPPPPPPAEIDLAACTLTLVTTSDVVADGTDQASVRVVVKDKDGAAMSGVVVRLTATGSANLITPDVQTDATGTAYLSVRSTVAEVKTLAAVLNPGASQLQIASSPTVTFVPGPPGVGTTFTVSPLAVLDDGVAEITATLIVRDDNANLITTPVNVAFSVPFATLTVSSGQTNSAGVLATGVKSTTPGQKTLTATMGGFQKTAAVTFLAGPPDQANSSMTILPSLVEANGIAAATITVVVKDTSGALAPGQSVALSATGGGNILAPSSGQTDSNGTFTATLKSTQVGTKNVTANVEGLFTLNGSVDFASGIPHQGNSSIAASPTTFAAGGLGSTVTVTVHDAFGNAVVGQLVNSLSASAGVTAFSPTSGTTNGVGQFTTTFTSQTAGSVDVSAQVGSFTLTRTGLTVTPGPADNFISSLTAGTAQALADGADSISFLLTVKDAYGNPIPGQSIIWGVSGGSGNTLTPGSTTTSSSGTATATLRSTTSGSKTVTAQVASLNKQASVTFLAGPPSSSMSTLSLTPMPVIAGVTGTAKVTVRDVAGNLVMGQPVSLVVDGSGNTLGTQSGVTDLNGEFSMSFSSTIAEIKHVTATVGAFSLPSNWTVDPGPASALTTGLLAAPSSATADGVESSTLTLTVQDVYGNALTGEPVSWSSDGTAAMLLPGSATTDSSGVATATLTSTHAELITVTATADGLPSQAGVTFRPGPPVKVNSSFTALPGSQTVGGPTIGLTVTALDAYSNVVPDAGVALTATGTSNTFVPTNGNTNSSGVFTAALSSTTAEAKQVVATFGGFTIDAGVTFTPGPPDAGSTTFSASPAIIVAMDGGSTLTVTVRDSFMNVVPNQVVSFSATGSNNLFDPDAGTTNASGVITSVFNSSTAEVKTVTATVGAFTKNASVTVNSGLPYGPTSSLTVVPASVPAGDNDTTTITFTVKDEYGNPVRSYPVSLAASGSGNTFVPAVPSGTTNSSGVFTATLKSTAVETKTITATAGILGLTAPVTFTLAPPKMVSVTLPASPVSGCVLVTYQVRQAQARPVDMMVEYSTGAGYARATACGTAINEGLHALPAAAGPSGTTHTFLWNSTADLPSRNVTSTLTVRLTPSTPGAPVGPPMSSSGVSLRNGLSMGSAIVSGAYNSPQQVAIADIDRDGKVDALVANTRASPFNGYVEFAKGNGNGTFTQTAGFQVGGPSVTPMGVVTADFNRDGALDFAAVTYFSGAGNTPGTVNVQLGNGAGTFGAPGLTLSGGLFTGHGRSIATGDFNRDGKADLAVGTSNEGPSGLLIYLGDGAGGFGTPLNFAFADYVDTIDPTDFNRDGILDLSIGTTGGAVAYLGVGDGTFVPSGSPVGGQTQQALPADFDRDGLVDVLTSSGLFLKGNGNGTFQPSVSSGTFVSNTSSLVARDFDGNGTLDVLVGSLSGSELYLGQGNGSFAFGAFVSAGYYFTAADVDNDLRPDLVSMVGVIQVHLNAQVRRCEPTFTSQLPTATISGALFSAAGHFNADGHLDLVTASPGSFSIRLGRGNGTFRAQVACANCSYANPPVAVRAGDVDGDGFSDVIVVHQTDIQVFRGNGSGGVLPGVSTPISYGGGASITAFEIADFDGDRKPDFIVGRSDINIVSASLNNSVPGTVFFSGPDNLTVPGPVNGVAFGDASGDGLPDIVAVGPGYASIFVGMGSFPFSTLGIENTVAVTLSQVRVADLNQDTIGDLVATNETNGHVYTALGTGAATFLPAQTFIPSHGVHGLAVGDFTGDGLLDVAVASEPVANWDQLSVLAGDGAGALGSSVEMWSSDNPNDVVAADFTNDGRLDVLTTGSNYGSVMVHTSRPNGLRAPASTPVTGAVGLPTGRSTVADFDRDGILDALVTPDPGFGFQDLSFMRGYGDGTFHPAITTTSPVTNPDQPVVADFNRDGILDLATINASTSTGYHVVVMTGTGGGAFATTHSVALPFAGWAFALVSGDFDRDGKLDLVAFYQDSALGGLIGYMTGFGDGTFGPPVPMSIAPGDGLIGTTLAAADINRDGKLDLVAAGGTAIAMVFGNGNGTFQAPLPYFSIDPGNNVRTVTQLRLADVDLDGRLDAVIADTWNNLASLYLYTGPNNAWTAASAPTMPNPFDLQMADVNDDGKLDWVTAAGYRADSIAVRPGVGDGTFVGGTEIPTYTSGYGPYSLHVADVNRDGIPDLCTSNRLSNDVTVMLGR